MKSKIWKSFKRYFWLCLSDAVLFMNIAPYVDKSHYALCCAAILASQLAAMEGVCPVYAK